MITNLAHMVRLHWLMTAGLVLVAAAGLAFLGVHIVQIDNEAACGPGQPFWNISMNTAYYGTPASSSQAHQAGDCFWQAYEQCTSATLNISPSTPKDAVMSYTTTKLPGTRCAVQVSWQTTQMGAMPCSFGAACVAWHWQGGNITPHDDTCTGLAWNKGQLIFSSCFASPKGLRVSLN